MTIPITNYCNSGLGTQLYLGTMAGMQTNEQTSGFKYRREHSWKNFTSEITRKDGKLGSPTNKSHGSEGIRIHVEA